jgi:plasmid stabilization system protein ParE
VKVRYTGPALADLEAILDYLTAHSPQGARRVHSRLQEFIRLLPIHPLIGTRTDDPAIRRLVITPHPCLVLYESAEDEIIIHAVRHASRAPSSAPISTPGFPRQRE